MGSRKICLINLVPSFIICWVCIVFNLWPRGVFLIWLKVMFTIMFFLLYNYYISWFSKDVFGGFCLKEKTWEIDLFWDNPRLCIWVHMIHMCILWVLSFVCFVSCLFLLFSISYFQKLENAKRPTFIWKDFFGALLPTLI